MKRIITFLGIQAKKTTYSFEGKNYDGEVFAEALRKFCDYESMLVCVTSEAQKKTFPILEKLEDKRIEAVEIPNGETTEQMWETFKKITEKVDENDHVIFDITHGLRSLPFLIFLFAAYLKAAKNVTIEAIYYGAWELGFSNNGIAPVIDLSEFVGMLDWLTATERFVEIGDGQALADLLKNAIPSREELTNNPASRTLRGQLEKTAKSIENISLALNVTRPIETMESATKLEKILQEAAPSFAERAKPFSLLSERVGKEYGQFALKDPKDQAALAENLWLQLQMIEWYLQRDRIVQAVTLAREWLISVLVLRFDESMFDNHNSRTPVENAINNAVEKGRLSPRPINPSRCDDKFAALAQADEFGKLWSQMTQLRNDIAHVGMNLDPKSALTLKNQAVSLYPLLQKLGQELLPERTAIK
ncbi:TIGR02221 family CRISPR-associated protein [Umezakia ovalisporum]|uniref:TIGR02221 family CRISPR-associated protein n=1 Tax=Umezakia ovalisporum TaxID=75695 RepID=UPI002475F466|nr:TIGR02221 family CRISPR-associated protein [Umezakia ovalisporum]MBI1240427.1 TIGR02221 family CRISPR-associated protein [Nostoc sp. RI_552]MDH6085769.1 TIGR02221 family CRISPR-associated protein [Umezakia ovalisporum TAC611]